MSNWIVKHNNKILRHNSDNNIVGYNYDAIADFAADGYTTSTTQVSINQNDSVDFIDYSTNADSWSWYFGETASPSTSNVQNPTGITYNTSGVTETVSLTILNQISSDTEIKTDYIDVGDILRKKLLINFYADAQDGDYQEYTWGGDTRTFNSFFDNTTGQTITLRYDDNTSSNYSCELIQSFNDSYNNGSITNDDTGVYPDNVMKYNFAGWDSDTPKVRISGLNTSKTYEFIFFGSRDGWVATTEYTITGGTNKDRSSVYLDTNSNTSDVVTVSSILPSTGGVIDFTVYWWNNQAFLGCLEIIEGG